MLASLLNGLHEWLERVFFVIGVVLSDHVVDCLELGVIVIVTVGFDFLPGVHCK